MDGVDLVFFLHTTRWVMTDLCVDLVDGMEGRDLGVLNR